LISKIGIELEGKFKDLPSSFFDGNTPIFRNDGSVTNLSTSNQSRYCHNEDGCGCHYSRSEDDIDNSECDRCSECFYQDDTSEQIGEIASVPYSKLYEINSFIKDYYPVDFNSSCGTHIHISLDNNLEYCQLMNMKMCNRFLFDLRLYGKKLNISNVNFWNRLDGKNHSYCRKKFNIIQQKQTNEQYADCRYGMFNFCFKRYGTIELRVLPVFKDYRITQKMVKFFYDWINIELKRKRRERIFKGVTYELLDAKPVYEKVLI